VRGEQSEEVDLIGGGGSTIRNCNCASCCQAQSHNNCAFTLLLEAPGLQVAGVLKPGKRQCFEDLKHAKPAFLRGLIEPCPQNLHFCSVLWDLACKTRCLEDLKRTKPAFLRCFASPDLQKQRKNEGFMQQGSQKPAFLLRFVGSGLPKPCKTLCFEDLKHAKPAFLGFFRDLTSKNAVKMQVLCNTGPKNLHFCGVL
jgi:hypothetical protein